MLNGWPLAFYNEKNMVYRVSLFLMVRYHIVKIGYMKRKINSWKNHPVGSIHCLGI